jgi:hypothetical protein
MRSLLALSEKAPLIHGGGCKVSRFKGEKGLAMGRHSALLSRERYEVATSALFYKV